MKIKISAMKYGKDDYSITGAESSKLDDAMIIVRKMIVEKLMSGDFNEVKIRIKK